MKRKLGFLIFSLGLGVQIFSFADLASTPKNPKVFLAEIRGTINPASSSYLKNAIREAEREQAEALVIELDTPGGLVSSVREMAQSIDQARVPVIVYVTPAGASATSAGALLMLASHVGGMAPGTNVGAAHPVDPQGKDIQGSMGEKVVSDTAAFARGLAELRGRNRELAEAIVSKSKSLTAQEALDQKMIEVVALNREELLQKLDGRRVVLHKNEERLLHLQNVQIRNIEMTWGQKLLHWIANPNIATLLMTLGMLCIYVEITTPGITVAGILGGIMLLVAFMAFQMLPIRTGGFLLLLLGIGLLIAEPFVTAHGAFAAGGVLAFVLGVLWVMDPTESDLRVSPAIWIPSTIVLGGGAALIATVAIRLRSRVKQVLKEIGGGGGAGLSGYTGTVAEVDSDGLGGKALFRGELWNFKCKGPLKVGEKVVIEQVDGMRVQVKPVHSA